MLNENPSAPGLRSADSLDLDGIPQPGITWVNRRVVIRDDEAAGLRAVVVAGVPLLLYDRQDEHFERAACAILVVSGHARQREVSAAFGVPRRTLHRWIKLYKEKGWEGLRPRRATGRKCILPASIVRAVVRLHDRGLGVRQISRRLGLSHTVVRGIYRREHLRPVNEMIQQTLPGLEATTEGAPTEDPGEDEKDEEDGDNDEEPGEACDGLWWPHPESATAIPRAGVLLALPILTKLDTFKIFRKTFRGVFGAVPAYGLEVMVLVMVFMALWRIKRPENLKELSPQELGKVLGLERVPEMKTVRRKLSAMARQGGAQEVMRLLAEGRIREEEDRLGVLYIDGHVRPYSGKFRLAKGYATQRNERLPATTDYWAHDKHGGPVLVVTNEINQHLTEVLEDVLADARQLAGTRRITVVFDRGGWSPRLFFTLIKDGFDLITYRKGAVPDLPSSAFTEHVVDEETHAVVRLHDEPEAKVGKEKFELEDGKKGPLVLREITKLAQDGHQVRVVTTRKDLPALEVLETLFARWRQENFFKYMGQEFDMDGLVEYGAEAVNGELTRPNPEVTRLTKEIKQVQARISSLQGQRCELIGEKPSAPATRGGFVKFIPEQHEQAKLLTEIRHLRESLDELQARRAGLPERISAGDLQRLKDGRKQVANLFKLVAYHVETELVALVSPHYSRSEDEARTLIAAALSSTADYEIRRNTLHVTLAPQASPHRSRAIAALARELNPMPAPLPGTSLRVRFDCREEVAAAG